MRNLFVCLFCALAFSRAAYPITATKAYVDGATNATLTAAKEYTDEHGGGGGASYSVVTNIAGRVTSNVVTKAYVGNLGFIEKPGSMPTPNGKIAVFTYDGNLKGGIAASKIAEKGKTPYQTSITDISQYTLGDMIIFTGTDTADFKKNYIYKVVRDYISPGVWSANYWQRVDVQPHQSLNGYVPTSRKVNGQPLTSDIDIEGMTDNALVLTNGAVKTKTGGNVTPANIGAATSNEVENVKTIVYTWESFLDGSNVVFSITNYISGSYNLNTAKLRILEMTNGVYREVYNSRGEIVMHLDDFRTNEFCVATNAVITSVDAKIAAKAEKAWGQYTSSGGVAPPNTVYMTAPSTVFAGGMEYERVAVGLGSVCVLTTKGAPAYTVGDEGTFKFQDDGGTNYFGFAKTDSYTIGCNTDGISASSGIVTLEYNVTMSGVPCVWYCSSIDSRPIVWEQLNLPDGSSVPGASHVVTWEQSPPAGKEICYLNCGSEPSGFFKATIEVAGSAKFMTNMPADLSGGILCTNKTDAVVVIREGANLRWQTTDGSASSSAPAVQVGTYDFNNGTNFTKRLYEVLTNVISKLGGSVTNGPAFN